MAVQRADDIAADPGRILGHEGQRRLEQRVRCGVHVAEQLVVPVQRGRVVAVAAGLQADLVQRVEIGWPAGPNGDFAGC